MNFFVDFKKVFTAEWLKLKGSGMIWLTLIMAAFIPAIFTLVSLVQTESVISSVNTANPWKELVKNCFMFFGGFFYPIFLTMVVIRLTQIEHRSGGWKLIETQPISKISLYLGKFSIAVFISLCCILALVTFSLLSGTVIMLVKTTEGFSTARIPFQEMLSIGFRLLISGLGILGIQFLFSVVPSSFIGPFSIGLIATISGNILQGSDKALWWPYSAPGLTVGNFDGSINGSFLLHFEWLSIAWMVLALWLGYQWYQRKNLKLAFFKPTARLSFLLLPAILFAGFFWYVNKPIHIPPHSRTVIAGTLETNETIDKVYLLIEPLYDTVLVIPVINNKFSFSTDKNIPAAIYYFKAGNMSPQQIFFGNRDSLFINLKSDGKSEKFTTSGNRLPENQFINNMAANSNYETYLLENNGYEMKPKAFANEVMRLWQKEVEEVDHFITAENLKPAEDFISLQKKLVSIRYLKLLDIKFPQWFRVYHPNEKLEFPKSIDSIRNTVNYYDSSLLSYPVYRDIVTEYFQQTQKLSSSNDTAYIIKASRALTPGAFRNYLIYNRIKEAIGRTRDSLKRKILVTEYLAFITDSKMQQQLLAQNQLLNSLHRGKPAPDFKTTALNKDTFALADFKGRYVVIDVWATWCAPCKVQSPNFERLAEQFTNPNIAFVALSIDDNQQKWKFEANKSSSVLQLIADDKNVFGKSFGIESIPRFMLLGPDGKIINVQMPYPSDPEFEEILRREIRELNTLL